MLQSEAHPAHHSDINPAKAGKPNGRLAYFKARLGKPLTDGPSPAGNWLRGMLVKAEYGQFAISYTVRHEMTNPFGTLHGGMIATMMDETIGATVYAMNLGAIHGSVNLQIDFIRAAPEGSTVRTLSTVHRSGSRIVNASCELLDEKERLLARASVNLLAFETDEDERLDKGAESSA